jgi:outer membrane lipoprotein LolB
MTRLWWGLVFLGLSGCATLNSPLTNNPADTVTGSGAISSFNLNARIAIHNGANADSAGLAWQGDFNQQHVELLSPLGSVVAVLDHGPAGVSLVLADGRLLQAADSVALTTDALGYALPLEGLPWWLLGQAQPGLETAAVHDSSGVLLQQQQAGWLICYDHWRRVGDVLLPGQVKLTRGALEMRWVIDEWHLTKQ